MVKKVEIYFRDLNPNAQSRLLKEFQTSAEEENWDVYPIAEIEREVEDDKTYSVGDPKGAEFREFCWKSKESRIERGSVCGNFESKNPNLPEEVLTF